MHVSTEPQLACFEYIITKVIGMWEDPEVEDKINFVDSEHWHTVGCATTNNVCQSNQDATTNPEEYYLVWEVRL